VLPRPSLAWFFAVFAVLLLSACTGSSSDAVRPTGPTGARREATVAPDAVHARVGEPVTFDGDFYHCRKFRLGLRAGARRPQLVLGALNAKMLALAGELADGVLLNYLPATAVPWCVEQVRAAEAAAGRPPGSCRIHAYVHVGVTDLESARVPAQKDLFGYIVVDSYARAFRRAGFGAEVDAVRAAHAERDRDAALAAVSDTMIGAIDIVGDADHVAAAVQAYRDAGVDDPVVMPLPWGPDRNAVIDATMAAAVGAG